MTDEEIYNKMTELFRDLFSDDAITLNPGTTAADIEGWDSFNHLSVIVAVETQFGIKMTTREIDNLKNVGDIVAVIQSKK